MVMAAAFIERCSFVGGDASHAKALAAEACIPDPFDTAPVVIGVWLLNQSTVRVRDSTFQGCKLGMHVSVGSELITQDCVYRDTITGIQSDHARSVSAKRLVMHIGATSVAVGTRRLSSSESAQSCSWAPQPAQ